MPDRTVYQPNRFVVTPNRDIFRPGLCPQLCGSGLMHPENNFCTNLQGGLRGNISIHLR
jgi:hypothetical protein